KKAEEQSVTVFNVVEARYEQGLATPAELIDAESSDVDARTSRTQAEMAYALAIVRLLVATGQSKRLLVETPSPQASRQPPEPNDRRPSRAPFAGVASLLPATSHATATGSRAGSERRAERRERDLPPGGAPASRARRRGGRGAPLRSTLAPRRGR